MPAIRTCSLATSLQLAQEEGVAKGASRAL